MKKLLILSLLLTGMLSAFSCSDNNTSFEELPAPTKDILKLDFEPNNCCIKALFAK